MRQWFQTTPFTKIDPSRDLNCEWLYGKVFRFCNKFHFHHVTVETFFNVETKLPHCNSYLHIFQKNDDNDDDKDGDELVFEINHQQYHKPNSSHDQWWDIITTANSDKLNINWIETFLWTLLQHNKINTFEKIQKQLSLP